MSFYTMADNNVTITANRDGALYNVALSNHSFVIKGMGQEFAPSVSGLVFSVGTGIAVIHGRHVTSQNITSDNTINLPPNTNGYVVIRMDLSRPIGSEAYLFATPTLRQEEINWNGTVYDLPIAKFVSTLTNSTIEDVRTVADKISSTEYSEVAPIDVTPSQWVDIVYPVGSIYLSADSTNPSQKFRGTIWQLVGSKLAVRENVIGNGKVLGLTDGNVVLALARSNNVVYNLGVSDSLGSIVSTSGFVQGQVGANAIIGVPTKTQLGTNLENSGLIVDTETIYSWKRTA